ncbi:hypothetical protein [Paenibacillus alvei]|nr:hypothetical protein [Paenibacillus alvei]
MNTRTLHLRTPEDAARKWGSVLFLRDRAKLIASLHANHAKHTDSSI